MKKRHVIIVLAVCLGLCLTWGALRASAAQSLLASPVTTPAPPILEGERIVNPDCQRLDPRNPASNPECRIRAEMTGPEGRGSMEKDAYSLDFNQPGEDLRDGSIDGKTIIWNGDSVEDKTGSNLQNPESLSLSVYVEKADGLPAANVYVSAHTTDGDYVGYAQTGVDGYAYLDIPNGTYFIVAYSYIDHFFLYQSNVTAPGSLTLSAVGTPEITLTAKKRDGSPLLYSYVYIGVSGDDYWMMGNLGSVDSNGVLVFHVTPDTYDIAVANWSSYYVLYTLGQDFTDPTGTVNFDMSTQPSAEIVANHPNENLTDLSVSPSGGNLYGFGFSDVPDGTSVVVSANLRYWADQYIVRQDLTGDFWRYSFYPGRSDLTFTPGEVYHFSVGGTMSVSGRTDDATAGDQIQLASTPVDSFGSFLSSIYTYTEEYGDWWYIYPHIRLTDPYGSVTNINSNWYDLPTDSTAGTYNMHFEWNTGPFQGVLTADSQFRVLPFNGLVVYVETADGLPAAYTYVYAYTLDGNYGYYGYTGSDGYAAINVPPGSYNVKTYSYNDHFLLYQSGVASPGNLTLSAVGTPDVTLTAKKTDGSPLDQAEVYVGVSNGSYWMYGYLGYVDPNGEMTFHVTPNSYDVGVEDATNYYGVYKVSQDFTNPGSVVDFDLSTQPIAELVAGHPYDSLTDLYLCPVANINCFGYHDLPDGAPIVVSTELGYYPYQYIRRDDTGGNHWNYEFTMDNHYEYIYFAPGEVLTFTVGGELSATGWSENAYVGDSIPLAEIVDSFGSFLDYIYYYTPDYDDYFPVYPEIWLTDPNGSETFVNWWWYYIPLTAPTGMYDMHLEWDTGEPYQGLLTADSQFEVLPQQTSVVIPVEGGELYSPWDDTRYEFAPGTFIDTVIITHTVRYVDIPPYAPLVGIGHFYDVTAVYSDTGLPAQPTQPYTITIGYSDWQRGPAIEGSLGLYEWDGAQWVLEPTSKVDPANNQIIATPDHFSTWGILGETNRVFLTMISRK